MISEQQIRAAMAKKGRFTPDGAWVNGRQMNRKARRAELARFRRGCAGGVK